MPQIRSMTPKDTQEVSALYRASWERIYGDVVGNQLDAVIASWTLEEFQALGSDNPDLIALVVEESGKIVGASLSRMDERHQAWVDRIHILPEYFGTGLADDLLRATLAKHSGLQTIAVRVLSDNERSLAFYEKHGFKITGREQTGDTFGEVEALTMTRMLSRS